MARVKRGTTTHARHKKILDLASGYRGRSSKCFKVAIQRVEKALQYAYRDRRNRKRDIRALWIQRINAATRLDGMVYGHFICGLKKLDVFLNRKMLADMAVREPATFSNLVQQVKNLGPYREVMI